MSDKKNQFRPLPVPSVTVNGLFGERQEAICAHTASRLYLSVALRRACLSKLMLTDPTPAILLS